MYYAGMGVGPFVAFFFSPTVIMVSPSSTCCPMPIWTILVGSKLGSANGVTQLCEVT